MSRRFNLTTVLSKMELITFGGHVLTNWVSKKVTNVKNTLKHIVLLGVTCESEQASSSSSVPLPQEVQRKPNPEQQMPQKGSERPVLINVQRSCLSRSAS